METNNRAQVYQWILRHPNSSAVYNHVGNQLPDMQITNIAESLKSLSQDGRRQLSSRYQIIYTE